MPTFTDKYIKSLTPGKYAVKIFEKGSDKGFCVQVTPAGSKTFLQQYTLHGKRRFLRLGLYPHTTLSQARILAREARASIDQGIDPQLSRAGGTVAELNRYYLTDLRAKGRRSVKDIERALALDVLPRIGDITASAVTAQEIREILYTVIKRGARVQANRLRSHLMSMFNHALRHDNDPESLGTPVRFGVTHNPVAAVPRNPMAENVGERVLTWAEIKQIWTGMPPIPRMAIQLILAFGGQRPGEVTGAGWSEFNGGVWCIPYTRTKNKKDHLLPVPKLAEDILLALHDLHYGEWLFPARNCALSTKPWDKSSLSGMVARYCKESGMAPWTPKDLRRTAKTLMGELGLSKEIRDRIQNHALDDVSSKHYDRYSYLNEKRAALDIWCERLASAVEL